ncbi:MAG: DNA-binding response regulator [Gammaproteobacteria bacterium]|nr:MAG: DNA-binding response regulator [Gammaproteobacteria bacterium]PCJ50569.1 MAG: DNA-binding response regulator [Gammaproteobacteria bacterium]
MKCPVYQIGLVEDDPLTNDRIRAAIDKHSDLSVVAVGHNCFQGRQLIRQNKLDLLLVDLGLPDGHGCELIRLAQSISPATEIMVVTIFGDEKNVLTAIEAGATGYLLKDGDTTYIGQSIKQIINGGSPISASIARHLLKRFHPMANKSQTVQSCTIQPCTNQSKTSLLTAREKQVLQLVAKGFSYSEISSSLEISIHTVTSHIKHIYKKLRVHSGGEAVFEAMQLGLIANFQF